MADLSKIKVGDKLKLELEVCELDLGHALYPVRCLANFAPGNDDTYGTPWVLRADAIAAEHIPAPRSYFKRGDWVKWDHGKADCIHRHCLFIKMVLTEPALAVIDDNGQTFTVAVDQLELDEAPE